MPEVYVAAGSNVRPRTHLRLALAQLRNAYPDLAVSRAYANAAAGFEGEDFINLAAGFNTDESLEQVLARLRAIEAQCGRERGAARWASRSMDLDLLLYGGLVGRQAGVALPRSDLAERAYMLGPMADLAPQLRHPVLGETMAALWQDFDRTAHPLSATSLEGDD